MLNTEERRRVLKVIRHCCNFGLLPAQVELSSWELIPYKNRVKIWKCYTCYLLLVLHALYKLISLVIACVLTKDTPLYELIIHAVLGVGGSVLISWYYSLYVKCPEVFGAYVKITLTGNIGDLRVVDNRKNSSWIGRMKQWTLQDFYVMCIPYTVTMAYAMVFLALFYHPSMAVLLYAGIPSQYKSQIIFGLLFLEEIRYMLVFMFIALPAIILQIISFDLVSGGLQVLMDSIQRNAGARNLQRTYKSLRHIQLYVGIVNLVNGYVIFSWKMLCMGMCIGTGYAAIAHFSDYPLFGLMYYAIGLNTSIGYIATCGRAFQIPVLFQKLPQRAILSTISPNTPASKMIKRQMRSIPHVGIKVGEFYTIERESTLIFIDFVLNNIVGMLVANRTG